MQTTEIREICDVLQAAGAMFDGGDACSRADIAEDWDAHGFDAAGVEAWCEAGVWCPGTALELSEAGVSARQLKKSGVDPYAACNGDETDDALIARVLEAL